MTTRFRLNSRGTAGRFLAGACLLLGLRAGTLGAQAAGDSSCNRPAPQPITLVTMPGNPFTAVATHDGCWVMVAMPTGSPGGGIVLLKRSGGSVTQVRVVRLDGATGAALTHDDKLLVVSAGGSIAFVDVGRLTSGDQHPILGTLSAGGSAGSIYVVVTADDHFAFVSNERDASVTVIDLTAVKASGVPKSAIVGNITVGQAPVGLALSPDGRYLYSTSEVGPPSARFPSNCTPEQTAAPARGGRMTQRGRGVMGSQAPDNPLGTRHPLGALIVIDVARAEHDPAHAAVAVVAAECNPVRVALSPAGDIAYVTSRHDDAILAFDTGKLLTDPAHALVAKVPVGTAPVALVVVDSGRTIVATNSNRFEGKVSEQTLSVVDARRMASGSGSVVGSIPAGTFPRELRVTDDGRTLLLTNFTSGTLELVDLGRQLPPAKPGGAP